MLTVLVLNKELFILKAVSWHYANESQLLRQKLKLIRNAQDSKLDKL